MDITKIKGIGPKKAEVFNRLSIYRDYEVYEKPVFIKDI